MDGLNNTKREIMDFDLFIIGGGVNGCGIARDAAGRGIRVGLAEMNDLASSTSSASTKLFHGGLRYLEYFDFSLVRASLRERDILLSAMPHISWPMKFVLPFHSSMRFDSNTPAAKLLERVVPWMKGRRPAWMIRFGLFLYDNIGGKSVLPKTKTINLKKEVEGQGLSSIFEWGFEYSDCWVDDSRLVVLNAQDAVSNEAEIYTYTKVIRAVRHSSFWEISLKNKSGIKKIKAKILINASGPWVGEILNKTLGLNSKQSVRLVRGSHIVVRQIFPHQKSYFFQGHDGRIIFAIPYLKNYTLIGTTDRDQLDPNAEVVCTKEEQTYLIELINTYLEIPISNKDIQWTFSGVRALFDDGANTAQSATREYVLSLNVDAAPVLNVFGGKITTYRKLAEDALEQIMEFLPMSGPWTKFASLPGGNFQLDEVDRRMLDLRNKYPFLSRVWSERIFRAYGTQCEDILGNAKSEDDLGQCFGANLFEVEVNWMIQMELVKSVDDILWRRSKLGYEMTKKQVTELKNYLKTAVVA